MSIFVLLLLLLSALTTKNSGISSLNILRETRILDLIPDLSIWESTPLPPRILVLVIHSLNETHKIGSEFNDLI